MNTCAGKKMSTRGGGRAASPPLSVRLKLFGCIILAAFLLAGFAHAASKKSAPHAPKRIVSLAPNITEILFALGLDSEIVGVTKFCNYPQKAKTKRRTGGLLDQNFETILDLEPDLVVGLPCNASSISKLKKLGVRTLTVENETVAEMLDSIGKIGKATGRTKKAKKLTGNLNKALEASRRPARGGKRPRVLIVVGHNPGSLQNLYVAGKGTFLDETVRLTGGDNIFGDVNIKYPQPSLEEVVSRNPQIIIESAVGEYKPSEIKRMASEWSALRDVDAVKNHRVYVWTEAYVTIPGPRLPLLLKKLRKTMDE